MSVSMESANLALCWLLSEESCCFQRRRKTALPSRSSRRRPASCPRNNMYFVAMKMGLVGTRSGAVRLDIPGAKPDRAGARPYHGLRGSASLLLPSKMNTRGKLNLVSIGPGFLHLIPPLAETALRKSSVIIGYELYFTWIQPWIE